MSGKYFFSQLSSHGYGICQVALDRSDIYVANFYLINVERLVITLIKHSPVLIQREVSS